MYVLVQGAVPKYNSAQCLLFYISCLIQLIVIFLFTKIFLLLMSMFYDSSKCQSLMYLKIILIILCSLYCKKNNS